MGRSVRQQVTVIVDTRVREVFTPSMMKEAMTAGGKAAVRLWQERTVAGYGANGNRFRRNRASTVERKRDRLRRRRPRGRFAAEDAKVVGRMTGKTVRDMQSIRTRAAHSRNSVSGGFEVSFKTEQSRKVAGYLEERGITLVGFAPATTAMGRKERRTVMGIINSVLRTTAPIKGIIIDRPA